MYRMRSMIGSHCRDEGEVEDEEQVDACWTSGGGWGASTSDRPGHHATQQTSAS